MEQKKVTKRPRIKAMRGERICRVFADKTMAVFSAANTKEVYKMACGVATMLVAMFVLSSCGVQPASQPLNNGEVEAMYLAACKDGGLEEITLTSKDIRKTSERFVGGCPAYYVRLKNGKRILVDWESFAFIQQRRECLQPWQATFKDFEGIWVLDTATIKTL